MNKEQIRGVAAGGRNSRKKPRWCQREYPIGSQQKPTHQLIEINLQNFPDGFRTWNDFEWSLMENFMIYSLAFFLIILWALGLITTYTLGGFIHILLIIAVVMIVMQLVTGRRIDWTIFYQEQCSDSFINNSSDTSYRRIPIMAT